MQFRGNSRAVVFHFKHELVSATPGADLDAGIRPAVERVERIAYQIQQNLLKRLLLWEYALLATVTSLFAIAAGSALATGLLRWRLDMDPLGLYWSGALTAILVSAISLGLGARYLLQQMRLNPALLLRSGG